MIPMEPGSLVMERKMLQGSNSERESLASKQEEAVDV